MDFLPTLTNKQGTVNLFNYNKKYFEEAMFIHNFVPPWRNIRWEEHWNNLFQSGQFPANCMSHGCMDYIAAAIAV
jgi:hypothetical protein